MATDDLNLTSLNPYLATAVPKLGPVVGMARAGSGQSNPTYILTSDAGQEIILRRKPFGVLLPSAHAIDREFRIMSALRDSAVPVPKMIAYCDDADVIGAEFYLMERVQGTSIMDPRMKGASPAHRTTVFTEMATVLGRLHRVDLAAAGLDDYGAPGDYFERGVARWSKQYRASETQALTPVEELMTWLVANRPTGQYDTTLVHGDYRIDNLLLSDQAPHIRAVLDWELSTTGHPLSDLGSVFMQWSLPPGLEGRGLMGIDRDELGIPSDKVFAEIYARERGAGDLSDLTYATAFAFFRMAAILQGVVKRGLDGNASDPAGAARMAPYVPMFAMGGLQVVGSS